MNNKIRINEIFYSLQGEGYNVGKPAIFVRFSGCNRTCPFCDTRHESFKEMSAREVIDQLQSFPCSNVVITGGEPLYQREAFKDLCNALHGDGYSIYVETNGDFELDPSSVEWLTVSPKGPEWKQKEGDELKLVYTGQSKEELEVFIGAGNSRFQHYYLQPNDNKNVQEVVEVVKRDPRWRLSLQTHKLIGVQ